LTSSIKRKHGFRKMPARLSGTYWFNGWR